MAVEANCCCVLLAAAVLQHSSGTCRRNEALWGFSLLRSLMSNVAPDAPYKKRKPAAAAARLFPQQTTGQKEVDDAPSLQMLLATAAATAGGLKQIRPNQV